MSLTPEQQEKILAELRWYGHEIAGGGPMIGWGIVARRANKRWYAVTLPLLMELDAVHGPIAKGDSCTTPGSAQTDSE